MVATLKFGFINNMHEYARYKIMKYVILKVVNISGILHVDLRYNILTPTLVSMRDAVKHFIRCSQSLQTINVELFDNLE